MYRHIILSIHNKYNYLRGEIKSWRMKIEIIMNMMKTEMLHIKKYMR